MWPALGGRLERLPGALIIPPDTRFLRGKVRVKPWQSAVLESSSLLRTRSHLVFYSEKRMARHCTCCVSKSYRAIDRALLLGESIASVSRRFQLSWDSVQRHFQGHLTKALPK